MTWFIGMFGALSCITTIIYIHLRRNMLLIEKDLLEIHKQATIETLELALLYVNKGEQDYLKAFFKSKYYGLQREQFGNIVEEI